MHDTLSPPRPEPRTAEARCPRQRVNSRALRLAVQVVTKRAGQRGFAPLPRRWVVERTHAWTTGHRPMSRDYERLPTHAEAMIEWAMIGLMAHRLAPAPGRRPWQPMAAT
jgi:hypothetical protein